MSNPYREPAKLPEREKFFYIDHIYIPSYAMGNSFKINLTYSKVRDIKVFQASSKVEISILLIDHFSGILVINVPEYSENVLCIVYYL